MIDAVSEKKTWSCSKELYSKKKKHEKATCTSNYIVGFQSSICFSFSGRQRFQPSPNTDLIPGPQKVIRTARHQSEQNWEEVLHLYGSTCFVPNPGWVGIYAGKLGVVSPTSPSWGFLSQKKIGEKHQFLGENPSDVDQRPHQNVGICKDVHPASGRAGHHWVMLVIRLDPRWIFLIVFFET